MTYWQPAPQRYQSLWVLLALTCFVVYSISQFLAAGRDDTFIMLWAGQTLGHAPWFVNFNYETQEIASSILGVFIAALTKTLPVGYALLLIKLLGLSAGCTTLILLWARRNVLFADLPDRHWLAMGALVATAASPVFQYWTLGGLETPYHALFLLAFCLVYVRSLTARTAAVLDWWLVGVGGLLILARVEAFWPILLAGGLTAVMRRFMPIPAATVRALYLLLAFIVAIMALRFLLTGALWPNPVYAKTGDFSNAIPAGWEYLLEYYGYSPWSWLQGVALIYGVAALLRLCACAVGRNKPGLRVMHEAVIGAMVLFHQLFVLISGGNWMEYFRFMSAIVPLLNILAFSMLGVVAGRFMPVGKRKFWLKGLAAVAMIFSLTQVGRGGANYAGNCAKPLAGNIFSADIERLSRSVILNNCAHARDWMAIKPFLDEKLPILLQQAGGHLTVVSHQGGFFPYFLRQKYGPEQVWFIDSAGLNELQIAQLPGRKSSAGQIGGERIDLALLGVSGALSEYFRQHPADLVYSVFADVRARENFLYMGYKVVWDTPHAVVFFRQPQLAR